MEDDCWRRDKIVEFCGIDLVDTSCNIPFNRMVLEDCLRWEATKNGYFWVRSAYYLEVHRLRIEFGESSGFCF